jgi:hypothetical protein
MKRLWTTFTSWLGNPKPDVSISERIAAWKRTASIAAFEHFERPIVARVGPGGARLPYIPEPTVQTVVLNCGHKITIRINFRHRLFCDCCLAQTLHPQEVTDGK